MHVSGEYTKSAEHDHFAWFDADQSQNRFAAMETAVLPLANPA
jgi:hypothetical protein